MCLTESACEELIPVMGHRMKFLKLIGSLKHSKPNATPQKATEIPETEVSHLAANEVEIANNGGSDADPDESDHEIPQASQNTRYVNYVRVYIENGKK